MHKQRCREREETAKEVRALAHHLKNNYKFQNVGIEAASLVPQHDMS